MLQRSTGSTSFERFAFYFEEKVQPHPEAPQPHPKTIVWKLYKHSLAFHSLTQTPNVQQTPHTMRCVLFKHALGIRSCHCSALLLNTRIQTWNEQLNVALSLVWLSAIMQAFWESNWSITILRVLIVYQKKIFSAIIQWSIKAKLYIYAVNLGDTISKISLTHKLRYVVLWTEFHSHRF